MFAEQGFVKRSPEFIHEYLGLLERGEMTARSDSFQMARAVAARRNIDFRGSQDQSSERTLPDGDHPFCPTAEKSVGWLSRRCMRRPFLASRICSSRGVVKTLSTSEYSAASLPTGANAAVSTRPSSK